MELTKTLLPGLRSILHTYLGVVLEDTSGKICSIGAVAWLKNDNKKYKDTLLGLMAFTPWSIPDKSAFIYCRCLQYIIGAPPVLGANINSMFCEANAFNSDISD